MGRLNLLALLAVLASYGESLAPVARQQSDLTLPPCASNCLASLLPTSSCKATDTACLCADQPFLSAAATCVQSNCTVKETLTTTRIQTTELCPQPIRDDSYVTRDVVWSIYGVAAFAVLARCVSRLPAVGGSGFGWDDWTLLLALALLTPLDVLCYLMTLRGLGRDIWMVEFDDITQILYYFWIDEFLYTFILDITKISVLLLYIRMWQDAESRKFRYCCLVLVGILAVHAVAMNIALAAGCEPVNYSWNQWDGEHSGHCINYQGQIYATAGLNILFDLLVFLLPIPKLIKLSFSSSRKKIALCLTFMIGLFVTVCSIIRLRYLTVWGDSDNLTWGYNPIAIWSNIECNASVLCACMPSLAGLVQRLWARISGTPISSYGRSSVMDDRTGDYELRLRSTSLTDPASRHEKRRSYPNCLSMNPADSQKPHMTGFDSSSSLGVSAPPPPPPLSDPSRSSTADPEVTHWHATKPLPRLSHEDDRRA